MILEAIVLLSALLAVYAALSIAQKHRAFKPIPGPQRDSFIFGNIPGFRRGVAALGGIGEHYLALSQEYGGLVNIWLTIRPVVLISTTDAVKDFLMDSSVFKKIDIDEFTPGFRTTVISLKGIGNVSACGSESILTSKGGPKWKRKRRLMDPAFTLNRLSTYLPKLYQIADNLATYVEDAIADSGDNVVDLFLIGGPYFIDAISLAGFSATPDELKVLRNKTTELRDCFTDAIAQGKDCFSVMLNSRRRNQFYNVQKDLQAIRDTGRDMIMSRVKDGTYGSYHDLLDYIITANTGEESGMIEVEETIDDFITMYMAGNSTTQTTMNFLLNELVRSPRVMDKLMAEVDSVWGKACIDRGSSSEEIGEVLRNMPYLDLVVKETLRMHPPVQVTIRRSAQSISLDGYNIPAGTDFHASQFVMQNSAEYWEKPKEFRPERFAEKTPLPYSYYPFLLGPRQCIGKNFAVLELKCIVSELLRRLTVARDPATPVDKVVSAQAVLNYPVHNTYLMTPR